MLKSVASRPALLVAAMATTTTSVFALGIAVGLYLYPQCYGAVNEHDDHSHSHEDAGAHLASMTEEEEHHEDHVALTRQAFDNLGLKLATVKRRDYWTSVLMPGQVVEIPGRSDLSVSAPVTGVVDALQVLPGESIAAEQVLCVIRITDEQLTEAQIKLLATLTRRDVIEREIKRLEPGVESGALAGKRLRDLEYEFTQLEAERNTLIQQLRGRGLPESTVQSVIQQRSLATTIEIRSPSFVRQTDTANVRQQSEPAGTSGYSIENLYVHPGMSLQRGDALCSLAYHAELYIEGTAFESDLGTIQRIIENGWTVTAETRHDADEGGRAEHTNLRLLRVDNHVNQDTQTVRFFVVLPNEVERLISDGSQRRFEQWKFRPGQRLHLRLPQKRLERQIVLPLDAVVVEGPNAFVFTEHVEPGEEHVDPQMHSAAIPRDDEHDVFVELEPHPVRLLHRDDSVAVLAGDRELESGIRIAMNNAYKLHLAMKMQAGGGGGHHHHDH